MTVRPLFRLVAGLALALFMTASCTTPGEAHEAHGAPAAANLQADVHAATLDVVASATDQGIEAGAAECPGHMGQPGSGKSTCCSNTCHAVISTELASLRAVTVASTVPPAISCQAALSGPTVHIKRPPRPFAALVG